MESSNVIFELTGPDAGRTIRLGGFDFQDGELQVAAAEANRIHTALIAKGVAFRRKPVKRRK